VAILEDDAYYDLRYDGERLPAVSSLAENPWAIYTGSFSKVIAPGIRVGYLCGAPEVVQRLGCLKQITDLHTGSLTQRIAYEYCARGFLEPGIQRLRDVYRARRDVMMRNADPGDQRTLPFSASKQNRLPSAPKVNTFPPSTAGVTRGPDE